MSTLVKVTQEHIDKGQIHGCTNCPVALAIRDAVPGCEIEVFESRIKMWVGGRGLTFMAGATVETFICKFDRCFKPPPFEFTLAIPKEFLDACKSYTESHRQGDAAPVFFMSGFTRDP